MCILLFSGLRLKSTPLSIVVKACQRSNPLQALHAIPHLPFHALAVLSSLWLPMWSMPWDTSSLPLLKTGFSSSYYLFILPVLV